MTERRRAAGGFRRPPIYRRARHGRETSPWCRKQCEAFHIASSTSVRCFATRWQSAFPHLHGCRTDWTPAPAPGSLFSRWRPPVPEAPAI